MNKKWCPAIILLLLSSNMLLAQVPAWGGGADQSDLSFGFSFSYVSSYFKIDKKPGWRNPFFDEGTNRYITDSLKSISSKSSPGFAVGFITRYRVTDHLELRTTPSLVFADRVIDYAYTGTAPPTSKQLQVTNIDLPLSLKLKSDRVGDFRAYLLGGVKYSLAVGTKRSADAGLDPLEKAVKNVGGFASYEAGLGCDIYFEFFKLSPEIKIANSMGNVLVPENQPFSGPVNKLGLHTLMFSLYFE
ncbi:MAG: type IX secretion/gliding motility protein PorT/SprT [Mucilaginibacter sp.]